MSKVLTMAGVSVLALVLVLGLAAPALAAPNSPPRFGDWEGEIVRGEVTSISDQEFVIQSGEDELTISVDEDTRYYQLPVPAKLMALARHRLQLHEESQQNRVQEGVGAYNQLRPWEQEAPVEGRAHLLRLCWLRGFCPFGAQAEFNDIDVGDSVVVFTEDSLARVVLIIEPTAYATVSGTVTDISSSFITVDSDDGPQVTLAYDESTVFVLSGSDQLETGQYVRIIYFDGLAKRVVVCPKAS